MAATEGGNEAAPNATLYVRGLGERIKIPKLTVLLREIFGEYGDIVEIVAKKNLKAKGQAFIVYDNVESAQEALEDLQGFDFEGSPMTLAFARTRSDATVLREDGEKELESHKRHRTAEKERKQAVAAAAAATAAAAQAGDKRGAPADASTLTARPAKATKPSAAADPNAIPDEYLPPNKTLFLREIPASATKEALTAIFSRFPGFKEVRTVPGRTAIAFVEYAAEEGAIAAKEATAGITVGEGADEGKMRVTYQRK